MYGLNTDIMWQQQRQAMQYQNDCREIQKAEAKAVAVENVRIQSMQVKNQIQEVYRQAWGIFQGMGAVKCKSVARKEWKIPNNRMGIYSYNKYDSEKGIFQFLQEEGFSPVLMAFGIVPDYLRRPALYKFGNCGRDLL